jgi:hypothetical protein
MILGATFQRLGCKPDVLLESGPVRLRAAAHAHVVAVRARLDSDA